MKLELQRRLTALFALAGFMVVTVSRADIGVVSPNGQQLANYLDSFQVQHWWPSIPVNWQTGSAETPTPPSPNTTLTGTHCSCFTTAAAWPLGIYILRPPIYPDGWHDMANYQNLWYKTNANTPYGWLNVTNYSATTNRMIVAQDLANQGYLVIADYLNPVITSSGHTSVIHPYTNTVANIMTVGPEECQAGTYNYNLTNVSTGFNQHPGAFPNNIDYFYHPVTYPITPVNPVLNSATVSNGILSCQVSSLVGRNYKIQITTNFINWTNALSYTNPNTAITLFMTSNFTLTSPNACNFGIRVTDPYGITSQVVTQSSSFTGITLNGSPTMNLPIGSPFVDPGVTAVENCSTSLAVTTNGSVNTNALGSYTLTYQATTSGGTLLSTNRTVNVNAAYATTTALVSSANPAYEGQPISFTATVSTTGASPTGSVTFVKNGTTILGNVTLSGSTAVLTTSGGAGTNSIMAIYGGDSTNAGSTSSVLQQVIQTGGGAVAAGSAALLQDGQDYAATNSTPITGRGPWVCGGGTGSSSYIRILAGDLSGATTPDIKPLPNTVNPEAKLQISKAGSTSRWYYRSLSNNVASGSVYFSFLMNMTTNPTTTDEFIASMLAGGVNTAPVPADPLTLHARKGADTSHFDLGIERLNGTTSWTSDLADNTPYLVVLKYTFGGVNSLYVNPTPGTSEPTPTVTATTGGTGEPSTIGTVTFYENSTNTSAACQYDVMRADNNWANVTPSINDSMAVSGATKLVFSSAAQTINVKENSSLMTVTLEDQSNNVFTATSDTVLSLNSSSGGGVFLSGSDGVTVITNATINSGTSTAKFYYNDSLVGIPTISVSGGLLTSATQIETIIPTPPLQNATVVDGNVSFSWSAVVGEIYQVQYCNDLSQPVWINLGSPLVASNSITTFFDPPAEDIYQRFYRITPVSP